MVITTGVEGGGETREQTIRRTRERLGRVSRSRDRSSRRVQEISEQIKKEELAKKNTQLVFDPKTGRTVVVELTPENREAIEQGRLETIRGRRAEALEKRQENINKNIKDVIRTLEKTGTDAERVPGTNQVRFKQNGGTKTILIGERRVLPAELVESGKPTAIFNPTEALRLEATVKETKRRQEEEKRISEALKKLEEDKQEAERTKFLTQAREGLEKKQITQTAMTSPTGEIKALPPITPGAPLPVGLISQREPGTFLETFTEKLTGKPLSPELKAIRFADVTRSERAFMLAEELEKSGAPFSGITSPIISFSATSLQFTTGIGEALKRGGPFQVLGEGLLGTSAFIVDLAKGKDVLSTTTPGARVGESAFLIGTAFIPEATIRAFKGSKGVKASRFFDDVPKEPFFTEPLPTTPKPRRLKDLTRQELKEILERTAKDEPQRVLIEERLTELDAQALKRAGEDPRQQTLITEAVDIPTEPTLKVTIAEQPGLKTVSVGERQAPPKGSPAPKKAPAEEIQRALITEEAPQVIELRNRRIARFQKEIIGETEFISLRGESILIAESIPRKVPATPKTLLESGKPLEPRTETQTRLRRGFVIQEGGRGADFPPPEIKDIRRQTIFDIKSPAFAFSDPVSLLAVNLQKFLNEGRFKFPARSTGPKFPRISEPIKVLSPPIVTEREEARDLDITRGDIDLISIQDPIITPVIGPTERLSEKVSDETRLKLLPLVFPKAETPIREGVRERTAQEDKERRPRTPFLFPRETPGAPRIPGPTEPTPPPPRTPTKPGDDEEEKAPGKKVAGYNAFVKERGKFIKINKDPIIKEQAITKTLTLIDNTPAVTGKIVKTKQKIPPSPFYNVDAGLLSKFTAKKGDNKIIYNEMAKFRLDSAGERTKLSAKQKVSRLNLIDRFI